MIIGNLCVDKTKKGLIQITLNTYHEGVPSTLFTQNELGTLIGVLKTFQAASAKPAKAAPPPADDDDWRDLI